MRKKIHSTLNKVLKNAFVRDVWTIFSTSLLKILLQAVYFVIIARTFGPDEYGSFIGTLAVVSLFYPFASWGSNWLLIQNVSRDQSSFADYCGTAILKNLAFSSAFILIISLILSLYPIPNMSIYSVFLLSLANLIFLPLSDICRDAFMSVGLMKYAGIVITLLSVNRFLGSLALITLFETPTLLIWSVLYCIATFATTVISSILMFRLIGYPKFKLHRVTQELAQGFAFSIGASAESIYSELDKSMLVKLATVESVGIYGAAVQIFNVSLTPIQAVMMTAYRKFFQKGASGINGSLELAKKLLPLTLGYAGLGFVGIILFAPLLPKILGEEYADSALALMWFSPLIFMKATHSLAADVLAGANYQKARSISQVLVAFLNGVLNFWLIPLYQWRGALWATLASELLLAILLWSFVYTYSKKSCQDSG